MTLKLGSTASCALGCFFLFLVLLLSFEEWASHLTSLSLHFHICKMVLMPLI